MEFAKLWVKQYRARFMLVETWANNVAARKFYEKMGFKQYGCLPDGLSDRHENQKYVDEIFYFLLLN